MESLWNPGNRLLADLGHRMNGTPRLATNRRLRHSVRFGNGIGGCVKCLSRAADASGAAKLPTSKCYVKEDPKNNGSTLAKPKRHSEVC